MRWFNNRFDRIVGPRKANNRKASITVSEPIPTAFVEHSHVSPMGDVSEVIFEATQPSCSVGRGIDSTTSASLVSTNAMRDAGPYLEDQKSGGESWSVEDSTILDEDHFSIQSLTQGPSQLDMANDGEERFLALFLTPDMVGKLNTFSKLRREAEKKQKELAHAESEASIAMQAVFVAEGRGGDEGSDQYIEKERRLEMKAIAAQSRKKQRQLECHMLECELKDILLQSQKAFEKVLDNATILDDTRLPLKTCQSGTTEQKGPKPRLKESASSTIFGEPDLSTKTLSRAQTL